MILLPVTGVSAHTTTTIGTSVVGTVIVQDTPTVDATVTDLQKTQLAEQVDQLRDENDRSIWSWVWNNASAFLSTLALAAAGGFTVFRYYGDRKSERKKQQESELQQLDERKIEREKQAEARFQKVVEGLGGKSEATQVGSAILLRTFVRKDEGNERFYTQAFDLAVAHLRLRHIEPGIPEPLTPLDRALLIAFKESYPLARDWLKQDSEALDATKVQLDNVYLAGADLNNIWMPEAYLRTANLSKANLSEANLSRANLRGANLSEGNYTEGMGERGTPAKIWRATRERRWPCFTMVEK
jgi:uncharacterized protein YjbI with pentapeptide repeats